MQTYVTVCEVSGEALLGDMEDEPFLKTGSSDPITAHIDSEEQLMTINCTSGTPARPPGVTYHHRGAYLKADNIVEFTKEPSGQVQDTQIGRICRTSPNGYRQDPEVQTQRQGVART